MTTDSKQLLDPAVFSRLETYMPRRRGDVEGLIRALRPVTFAGMVKTIAVVAILSMSLARVSRADDQDERQRTRMLEQMRDLAEGTKVRFENGDPQPEIVPRPVFRYDDQPRRFLDATMWVWTDGERPVAFEKIEAMPQDWQFCFTSVADDLLDVQWSGGRRYRSIEPGIDMRPLPGAPNPATQSSKRKLEIRKLARDFSARIIVAPVAKNSEVMRLLSTPIYEYADPKTDEFRGGVLGFTTNGTNPDVLVILEASGDAEDLSWHYAAARMTTGGVTLKYRDQAVWEVEYVNRQAAYPTWTFFHTPRKDEGKVEGRGEEGEK